MVRVIFATTINYVDRGVLGVLEPELRKTIKWTNTQYGDINFAFTLASATRPGHQTVAIPADSRLSS